MARNVVHYLSVLYNQERSRKPQVPVVRDDGLALMQISSDTITMQTSKPDPLLR